MSDLFKKHWVIIILCLVTGILSSVSYYVASHAVPDFQGVYSRPTDDVDYYRARTREVLDGHPFLINPYLAERKDGVSVQFWMPDVLLSVPIGLFGLSVPEGFILWNFFLIPALMTISYGILMMITGSRLWSFLVSAYLYLSFFNLDFLRLPSPGMNFVFWLLTFFFLFRFVKYGLKRDAILSSIFFGTLFNIYPYYWTFYTVFFAVFISLAHFLRVKDVPIKKFTYIFLGGLLLGLPYFISVLRSINLSEYSETLRRTGVISTHFPSGVTSVFILSLVLFVVALSIWRKKIGMNKETVFLAAGALGGIISVNQHVITGSNLEFSSHYYIQNVFWFSFTAIYLALAWIRDMPVKWQKAVAILSITIVSITGLAGLSKLVLVEIDQGQAGASLQRYDPVFEWLNDNARKDEVVLADDHLSSLIPVYTSLNVYFSPYVLIFMMPSEETENRFIISHYFEEFDGEYILLKYRSIFGTFYLNNYAHNQSKNKLRRWFGLPEVAYVETPEWEIDRIKQKAKEIQSRSFEENLKTYRVDYVVWNMAAEPEWEMDSFDFLQQVYLSGTIVVYKVK